MAKKKSKKKTTVKKDTRSIQYKDPCFHCKNLEISGTGMTCLAESEAFWNDEQGFEVNKEENAAGICLLFKDLKDK